MINETTQLSQKTVYSSERFATIIAENLQAIGGIYQSLQEIEKHLGDD